jgi:hypothetical protein
MDNRSHGIEVEVEVEVMKPAFRLAVARCVSKVREVDEHGTTHSRKPRRARSPSLLDMKLSVKSSKLATS